jgi:rhodanese-related sulfurtransferase
LRQIKSTITIFNIYCTDDTLNGEFKLSMNLISREELKQKLDRGDKFKLVNALGEWAFNAKHIPGSINVSKMQDAKKMLNHDDDIVIYCSNPSCIASIIGYQLLTRMGYNKLRCYAGGISDWEQAGYPLEGNFVS